MLMYVLCVRAGVVRMTCGNDHCIWKLQGVSYMNMVMYLDSSQWCSVIWSPKFKRAHDYFSQQAKSTFQLWLDQLSTDLLSSNSRSHAWCGQMHVLPRLIEVEELVFVLYGLCKTLWVLTCPLEMIQGSFPFLQRFTAQLESERNTYELLSNAQL